VLDEVVEVPARKVTTCTFGGPRLDQMFITTSREGLEPGIDPLAGSLFPVVVGVNVPPGVGQVTPLALPVDAFHGGG
jgi:sugar lactone lactonase YvrE